MSTPTNTEQRSEWREIIRQHEISGLSGRRFCQEHQLRYHQFRYWHRKFCVPGGQKSVENRTGSFTRVVVDAAQPEHCELTLRLPDGVSIGGITQRNMDVVLTLLARL